jgi:hypothetical protein
MFSVRWSSDPGVWQSEELVERGLAEPLTIECLSALERNLKGLSRCHDPCKLVRHTE